ncbi:MAG: hypothetical protein ACRD6R_10295 [Candidatus Polarisedimenticolia bacterium]
MRSSGVRVHRVGAAIVAVFATVVTGGMGGAASALDINGFTRAKGKGDVAFSFTSESYDEFWVGRTKVTDPGLGEVETRSLSVWLAYGLNDRLTLIANLPWVRAEGDGSAGFEEKDLQDLSLLGQFVLASGGSGARHALVGAVGFRIPASGYEANTPVDIGDGSDDWLFRLVYQLRHRGFYLSQQIGVDLRSGDTPDGFPLYTEIGATWGKVTLTAFYQRLESEEGTDIGDPGFTFPSNQDEFERTGAKVYWRLHDRIGVALAGWNTLGGRNTGDSTGASFGFNFGF